MCIYIYIFLSIYTTSLGFLIPILNFSPGIYYFVQCLMKTLHCISSPFLNIHHHFLCSNTKKLRSHPSLARAPAPFDSSAGTHISASCILDRLVQCQNHLLKPYSYCLFPEKIYIHIRDLAIINGGKDQHSSTVHSSLKKATAHQVL